jgi:hypothetical protein
MVIKTGLFYNRLLKYKQIKSVIKRHPQKGEQAAHSVERGANSAEGGKDGRLSAPLLSPSK